MKRLIPVALAALALGAAATVTASPFRVSPQSIIVNPAPNPNVAVRVWVDRDPGGYGTAVYRVGDPIRIGVNVSENAYVYLFNVNASGAVTLVLPNGYSGGEHFLYAGETRTFPAPGSGYQFTVGGPAGTDTVFAIASTRELSMHEIYDIEAGGFYDVTVTGGSNLARALSIVVQPLPADAWVTDAVQYRVSGW